MQSSFSDLEIVSEKDKKCILESQEIEKKKKADCDKRKIGFLAQDLQKVFPELVEQDSSGFFYVDYIGIIPVIVEALKEQQEIIEELKIRLEDLDQNNGGIKKQSASAKEDDFYSSDSDNEHSSAYLEQNVPNPFNQTTQIKYYLSDNISTAYLCFYNLQGNQLKQIPLSGRGEGAEIINGAQFSPGIYLYALIADGKEVDVKRMVITE